MDAISETTSRGAKLTGQLLAFARRQALKPETLNVVESLNAIVEIVRSLTGSGIVIETHFPETPLFINVDRSQFDTSIVNMAVNARDAMNGEGRLTINVGSASAIPARPEFAAIRGDFVVVSIADTGSGIAPDMLERIFEPFFTTKAVGQGTGLGLSQVFGFAKQSAGEITVDSQVGRGTTFTLYMPSVVGALQTPDGGDDLAAPTSGEGIRVLVVEDNADVGNFATHALAELGYTTIWAASGEKALAELAEDAYRFDVVFSDVVMPGMSGIELGREIRRRHSNIPIVLTSGYSDALAQNGAAGFELLHKPYSVAQLSQTLSKAAKLRRG
jgi:CheY-like chemotaxis protein